MDKFIENYRLCHIGAPADVPGWGWSQIIMSAWVRRKRHAPQTAMVALGSAATGRFVWPSDPRRWVPQRVGYLVACLARHSAPELHPSCTSSQVATRL